MTTSPVETIDLNFLGRGGLIGSFLLRGDGSAALVETGPTSTLESLLGGLKERQVAPDLVEQVFLTHIHLDHAGASGNLCELLPNATFYVHEIGAQHMIDPSKLLKSATRLYGEQMDFLWGEMRPLPEDRLVILQGGETVTAAGREMSAHYTPGHAAHHLAFLESAGGVLMTGDVGGVRMAGCGNVRPPSVPPEYDPDAWRRSIALMRELSPASVWLTHCGGFTDVPRHLDDLEARLDGWLFFVERRMDEGKEREEILPELREYGEAELDEYGADDETRREYEVASAYEVLLQGIMRHLSKR